MLPLIPFLLSGSAAYGGLNLYKKHKTKAIANFVKKTDTRYQALIRRRFDPLFGAKRETQLQDFAQEYSDQERDINRRLGLSTLNTGVAVLGTYFYPPLLLLNALGLMYILKPVVVDSIRVLLREKRLKYKLMALFATTFTFLNGFYIIGSLIIAILFLAFKIAVRTEDYSHKALADVFARQAPATVWLLVEGTEVEIPFSQLQPGDVIVLSGGHTIPVDGHITYGTATVDQHILTGEAQPVEKSTGDTVLASTVMLTGKIHMQVDKTGQSTLAAQIGEILDNASHYRVSNESRSEKLVNKLTGPVLATSGLAWLSVGPVGAAAVLNSSFGSGMIIAAPLSVLSYLNIASHNGILVKDGRSLETLHTVDTVVFDKTGTLTLEQPEVSKIYRCGKWTETQVLHYAAMAEHRQTHPIAKAILAEAEQRKLTYVLPDSADYEIGFGIRVHYQGQTIQVGSKRFMQQTQIEIPADILVQQDYCQQIGNSLVMVAVEGKIIGAIELQAQLRPETNKLVRQLHKRGLKLYILSGDHTYPTQHLAERLGIDDFFAEVLPEGKAEMIEKLQQQGRKVCFVGDGINDAIALRQADVSVSLRGATTVATDSAQIVLVSHSLQQLNQLFDIASSFNSNLNRTMVLAYVPGSVLIAGVFLLHFGMPAALVIYISGLTASITNALYPLTQLPRKKSK